MESVLSPFGTMGKTMDHCVLFKISKIIFHRMCSLIFDLCSPLGKSNLCDKIRCETQYSE